MVHTFHVKIVIKINPGDRYKLKINGKETEDIAQNTFVFI